MKLVLGTAMLAILGLASAKDCGCKNRHVSVDCCSENDGGWSKTYCIIDTWKGFDFISCCKRHGSEGKCTEPRTLIVPE